MKISFINKELNVLEKWYFTYEFLNADLICYATRQIYDLFEETQCIINLAMFPQFSYKNLNFSKIILAQIQNENYSIQQTATKTCFFLDNIADKNGMSLHMEFKTKSLLDKCFASISELKQQVAELAAFLKKAAAHMPQNFERAKSPSKTRENNNILISEERVEENSNHTIHLDISPETETQENANDLKSFSSFKRLFAFN